MPSSRLPETCPSRRSPKVVIDSAPHGVATDIAQPHASGGSHRISKNAPLRWAVPACRDPRVFAHVWQPPGPSRPNDGQDESRRVESEALSHRAEASPNWKTFRHRHPATHDKAGAKT